MSPTATAARLPEPGPTASPANDNVGVTPANDNSSPRARLDAIIIDLGRLAADLYFEGKLGHDPEPRR